MQGNHVENGSAGTRSSRGRAVEKLCMDCAAPEPVMVSSRFVMQMLQIVGIIHVPAAKQSNGVW
jgi:hypothetical protein